MRHLYNDEFPEWGMLTILAVVAFLVFSGIRIGADIQFDRNCEGYLKRAADANTIELAKKQLETAIAYIEQNGMTNGYTSVFYRTPSEDVGFWYTNLKSSLHELETVSPTATQLEKSNLLIKLRETLIDSAKDGIKVTVPSGISVFPNHGLYAWWGWITGVTSLIGAISLAIRYGG